MSDLDRIQSIALERELPLEQAFEAARGAMLEKADGKEIFFYRNATFRLETLWPENLNPASLYLIKKNLDFQRELRRYLLEQYGIDTLRLDSVLHLQTAEGMKGMHPPYVEISEERLRLLPGPEDRNPPEKQTLRVPIIIDGLHRARIAMEEGLPLNCVVCSGAYDANYLYTSYPVHWSQVKVYDEVPPVKKFYRRQQQYSFMRPLEAFLLGAAEQNKYGRKK